MASFKRAHASATAAVNDGLVEGGSLLGSILAGTLLGLLGDRWLGTDPWLVTIGVIVGSISGFARMRPAMVRPTGKKKYRGG